MIADQQTYCHKELLYCDWAVWTCFDQFQLNSSYLEFYMTDWWSNATHLKMACKLLREADQSQHWSDKTPFPVVFNKNITYHHFEEKQHGSERVWINPPRNGLDKQQCKLQVPSSAQIGDHFLGENTSQHQQKDGMEQGCIFSIFTMLGQKQLHQFSG